MFNKFKFDRIVLFCAYNLLEILFIDKFVPKTSPERTDELVLTFPNHALSVSIVPDKFANEDSHPNGKAQY